MQGPELFGSSGRRRHGPRSRPGTAFLRRAPPGSNPGAGCCTARVPASGASTGWDGKKIGRVGERITPRGAPGGATFKFARRSSGAPLPRKREFSGRRYRPGLFDNLGPAGPRDDNTRSASPFLKAGLPMSGAAPLAESETRHDLRRARDVHGKNHASCPTGSLPSERPAPRRFCVSAGFLGSGRGA